MSACEGLGSLMYMWRYLIFRTVYAPLRSGITLAGSKHATISSVAFYTHRLDSTRRDLWTAFMSMRSTFLLYQCLQ